MSQNNPTWYQKAYAKFHSSWYIRSKIQYDKTVYIGRILLGEIPLQPNNYVSTTQKELLASGHIGSFYTSDIYFSSKDVFKEKVHFPKYEPAFKVFQNFKDMEIYDDLYLSKST